MNNALKTLGNLGAYIFFVVYAFYCILVALLPPSAVDELIYHLEVPKQILIHGRLPFSPDNVYAYFPQLGEQLLLIGMCLAGEVGAKLMHVFAGFVLVCSLYAFSRKHLPGFLAFLPSMLFLSVPSVMVVMPLAYVDIFFCLFTFLAFCTVTEYLLSFKWRWAVLTGIMTGAAFATKYTGIHLFLALACTILVDHLITKKGNFGRKLLGIGIIGALTVAFVFPYLWRNYIMTGWPFFPFGPYSWSLHSNINWDGERAKLFWGWAASYGTTLGGNWRLFEAILSPVMVFLNAQFDEPRFYDGVIGPIFLIIPFLLFGRSFFREAVVNRSIIFSIFMIYFWAFTTRQVRFLLPVLPVLSFLLVYGISKINRKAIRIFLISATLFSIFWGVGISLNKLFERDPVRYWLGKEPRDRYLSRQFLVYPAYQIANKLVGEGNRVYLIDMQNYVYWLKCAWRSDFIFEHYRIERLLQNTSSSNALQFFFQSQGVSHLLINTQFLSSRQHGLERRELVLFREFVSFNTRPIASFQQYKLYELK